MCTIKNSAVHFVTAIGHKNIQIIISSIIFDSKYYSFRDNVLWYASLCLLYTLLFIPDFSQILQENNSEWLLEMCIRRLGLVENILLQIWQACDTPSMCVSEWACMWSFLAAVLSHILHFHSPSFFSISCSIWSLSSSWVFNREVFSSKLTRVLSLVSKESARIKNAPI